MNNILTISSFVSYIIETCHTAALSAAYSRRAKIKVDDFKFVLRRDPVKLGRVLELHSMQREIKTKKRMFEVDEKRLGREAAAKEAKAASKKKGDDQDDTEKAKAAEASATTQPDHDLNDDIVNGLLDDLDDEDIANGGHGDDDLDDRENAKKRPRIS